MLSRLNEIAVRSLGPQRQQLSGATKAFKSASQPPQFVLSFSSLKTPKETAARNQVLPLPASPQRRPQPPSLPTRHDRLRLFARSSFAVQQVQVPSSRLSVRDSSLPLMTNCNSKISGTTEACSFWTYEATKFRKSPRAVAERGNAPLPSLTRCRHEELKSIQSSCRLLMDET
jgi:hypothetical protein